MRELNIDTKSEFPIVMVAITHVPPDELNAALVSAFPHRIDMGVPNEAERAQLVRHFLARTVHGADVSAEYIAKMTAGFLPRDLQQLVTQSLRRAAIRASHLELPPTITTIDELHQYLNSPEPKLPRTPPSHTTQFGQAQVH